MSRQPKVHLDSNGHPRCGNYSTRLTADETAVTCGYCRNVINGLEPCGTVAAYNRHRSHGEETCAACRQAVAADSAARRKGAVHLDRDGRARCGQFGRNSQVTTDLEEVTCQNCRDINGGIGRTLGTLWSDVKPHGTLAAYRRHYRRGERPCESCKQANAHRENLAGAA